MRVLENGGTKSSSLLMWLGLSLIFIKLTPTSIAVAQEPVEAGQADETAVESAQETPPPPPPEPWHKTPTKNNLVLSLGGAIWPSLGDKEFGTTSVTSLPGSLNSLGIAFQVAYERPIVHWQRGDLYLGAEFGGFRFDNDQEAESIQPTTGNLVKGALDSFAWYAGPSIKFMVGEGPVRFFVGGGVGYYSLKLTESDEVPRPPCANFGPCFITKRSLTKSAIGGHVSLGIDFAAIQTQSGWQWRIRLEDAIHLVNFGSLDNFSPGVGGLSGPVNVIQISVMAGF